MVVSAGEEPTSAATSLCSCGSCALSLDVGIAGATADHRRGEEGPSRSNLPSVDSRFLGGMSGRSPHVHGFHHAIVGVAEIQTTRVEVRSHHRLRLMRSDEPTGCTRLGGCLVYIEPHELLVVELMVASADARCGLGSPGLTSSLRNQNRDRRAVGQCQWVMGEVVGRDRHVSRGHLELDRAVIRPHHVPSEWKIPSPEMRGDLAEVTERRHVPDSHIPTLSAAVRMSQTEGQQSSRTRATVGSRSSESVILASSMPGTGWQPATTSAAQPPRPRPRRTSCHAA